MIEFHIYFSHVKINKQLVLQHTNIERCRYRLSGIIYFGGEHFTCSIVDRFDNVWYSNEMISRGRFVFLTAINSINESDLFVVRNRGVVRHACIVIYSKQCISPIFTNG